MHKKTSRKLVYTLSSQSSHYGHSLGVNSLAIDPNTPAEDSLLYSPPSSSSSSIVRNANGDNHEDAEQKDSEPPSGILYSAGRDGAINAWTIHNMDLSPHDYYSDSLAKSSDFANKTSTSSTSLLSEALKNEGTNNSLRIPSTKPQPASIRSISIGNDRSTSSVSKLLGPSLTAFLHAPPPETNASPLVNQHTLHSTTAGYTTFGISGQNHTNWVNDIVLVNNKQQVVSCSSDLTVKLWNPHNDTQHTIGQHRDYVKCLATPSQISTDWVVSGGLDRRIIAWDLNRGSESSGKSQEKFSIDLGPDDKGSIYALDVSACQGGGSIIAAGGPEATVRLWDSRTAGSSSNPIAKLVGHTANIRSILISERGEWVLSASSDSSIKLWSVTAGRLLHTFDMHSDSVWSLYSDHPSLHVFYSADRTGMVAKTDLRGVDSDIDCDAVCTVICNEHQGISKVISAGDTVWTATSNSRIHRWRDFDTTPYSVHRQYFIPKDEPEESEESPDTEENDKTKNNEPEKDDDTVIKTHFLSTQGGPSLRFQPPPPSADDSTDTEVVSITTADVSYDLADPLDPLGHHEPYIKPGTSIVVDPIQVNPIETLKGKIGLIKHRLLSDRQRVLTTDNAGEIILWDLLRCVPLKSFGTGLDMESLADQLCTPATMSNWCQVATRTGELFVTLDQNTCFDAEVYADEIIPEIGEAELKAHSELNPAVSDLAYDQRINLGKWVIRNLLANLLTEEVHRDKAYRANLVHSPGSSSNISPPNSVVESHTTSVNKQRTRDLDTLDQVTHDSPVPEATSTSAATNTTPAAASTAAPAAAVNNNKAGNGGGFMGRFRFGKGNKKDKAKANTTPAATGAPSGTPNTGTTNGTSAGSHAEDESSSTQPDSDQPEPHVLGEVIAELRKEYIGKGKSNGSQATAEIASAYTPPLASELPVISIPPHTKIMISELAQDSGGLMDLYRGRVGQAGIDADKLESIVPKWIANVLLLDQIPVKAEVKVGFIMLPCDASEQADPSISPLPIIQQGGGRLNGYQMLRAHKAVSYLIEKLRLEEEVAQIPELAGKSDEEIANRDHNEWLELLCQNQVVPRTMTLATIRTRMWRSGGDVVLKYRRRKV